jgi:hypothetical protein
MRIYDCWGWVVGVKRRGLDSGHLLSAKEKVEIPFKC